MFPQRDSNVARLRLVEGFNEPICTQSLASGGYSVKLVFLFHACHSSRELWGLWGGAKCVSSLKAFKFKLKTDKRKNCQVPGWTIL